jgi:mannitol-1-/sugar-/sorbitol-6-phosphatase
MLEPPILSDASPALILPEKSFAGFLFDMDGTILNSIAAAERVWSRWAEGMGLDVAKFLPYMHGKRGIDTISSLNLPGIDPQVEADKVLAGEIEDVEGVVPIPGAVEFLAALPPQMWSIVTSSPLPLAKRRLAAAGIPEPARFVTAENVTIGKPNPQGYLLGAERLGVSPAEVLVFEDVLAGVQAGEGAGSEVMVITETHSHPIEGGNYRIQNYLGLAPEIENGRIRIVRRG